MKKKIESELISIAHRIIKLEGKGAVVELHAEVSALYEHLTVLKFAQDNFEDDLPTIGSDKSFFATMNTAFTNKISDNIEVEDKTYINMDDREDEAIMEPIMNKIRDMVAHMPDEAEAIETIFEEALPTPPTKTFDIEDITAGFDETPIFEPVSKQDNGVSNEKKSLNDKLKVGGLNIGLNDKIAFIKHLFGGESEDYDRVVSQLNTFLTYNNAKSFIEDIVKPDYNNWVNKEEFEERFMQIIEAKFN